MVTRDHNLVVRDVLQAIYARERARLDDRELETAHLPVKRTPETTGPPAAGGDGRTLRPRPNGYGNLRGAVTGQDAGRVDDTVRVRVTRPPRAQGGGGPPYDHTAPSGGAAPAA
ncbi:hypothetical protein EIP91_000518 [Steccherinum ochraceum]|uniref:Uncharacterized protein n=1 Tax=Steccherinum ochraceum TaxID=92696 RepID=A0A4R0RQ62_9APHY|nr:hypothetical protein EIP91_000518 [Steccherinum ochraceum]